MGTPRSGFVQLLPLCAVGVPLGKPGNPHIVIVRCEPGRAAELQGGTPIAFKPERLLVAEASLAASDWRIHDVIVDTHAQLAGEIDGALLAPGRLGGFLASGFRTVGAQGAPGKMEIHLSRRRGEASLDLATFFGAILGVEVDPDLPADTFSGRIRLRSGRGWDGLVAATCEGPARVKPEERARFVVRPVDEDLVFRPVRLEIDHPAVDWEIVGLEVDGISNLSPAVGDLPGLMFSADADAIDPFVTFSIMRREIAIEVRYVGTALGGGRFGMTVRGDVFARAERWPALGSPLSQRPGMPLG